jgi:hypothetical protein
MRRFFIILLSISVLLPTLAFSEMSDREYCRMRFGDLEINTFDIFNKSKSNLNIFKRLTKDLHEQEMREKYPRFFTCIEKKFYQSQKAYYEKNRAMVLDEGGFITGNLKVCKKMDYFELRRPSKNQCWILRSGTNVKIERNGSKVPIKLSWLNTVYGDALICASEQDRGSCIQSHKKIK